MNLCAVMTKTEQSMTNSRGGHCVEKIYIYRIFSNLIRTQFLAIS